MIGFQTHVNLKDKTVQTRFRKETRTFVFNDTTFTLKDALVVAAEDMHNQLILFLAEVVAHVMEEEDNARR